MSSGGRWGVHAIMLGVLVSWSGAFAMIKIALHDLTPLDLTLLRFLVAAPPLAAILLVTGVPRFPREDWGRLALIAFLSVAGYHFALNFGETAVTAGVAALIVATGPVWTALGSALVLKERITLRKAGGIAVALAGVVVLVLGRGDALNVTYLLGAFVALLAPMMWAASSIASKPLLARHSPLAFTAVATLLGTLPLLPIAVTGTTERALAASGWTWIALLHLGLLATVAGYIGFNYALRQLTATETMTYLYLNPVFALGWAWLLTREGVTLPVALAAALVIGGVALTNLASRKPAAPQAIAAGTIPK